MKTVTGRLLILLTLTAGCRRDADWSPTYGPVTNGYGFSGNNVTPPDTKLLRQDFTNGDLLMALQNKTSGDMKSFFKATNGYMYLGECKDGRSEGLGTAVYSNSVYHGEWKSGKREGQGIQRFSDGTVYIGTFHDDKLTGSGLIWYTNGNAYAGGFSNGLLQGSGMYFWRDADMIAAGEFDNDIMVKTNFADAASSMKSINKPK